MKRVYRGSPHYPGASAPGDEYGWCIVADTPMNSVDEYGGVMAGPYADAEYAKELLLRYASPAQDAHVELRRIGPP